MRFVVTALLLLFALAVPVTAQAARHPHTVSVKSLYMKVPQAEVTRQRPRCKSHNQVTAPCVLPSSDPSKDPRNHFQRSPGR